MSRWGVILDGADREMAAKAAMRVYESQFPEGNARWCDVSIRHYARCIVEVAQAKGWLCGIDLAVVRPPYQSSLPLAGIPDKQGLEALDTSRGYGRVVFSACGHDFYRYIIDSNHPSSFQFSSSPLPDSGEPSAPFLQSEARIPNMQTPMSSIWPWRRVSWRGTVFDLDGPQNASMHSTPAITLINLVVSLLRAIPSASARNINGLAGTPSWVTSVTTMKCVLVGGTMRRVDMTILLKSMSTCMTLHAGCKWSGH